MELYRLKKYTDGGSSAGFSWHSSRREAEQAGVAHQKDEADDELPFEVESVEFDLNKRGVLALLNRYAKHSDNG